MKHKSYIFKGALSLVLIVAVIFKGQAQTQTRFDLLINQVNSYMAYKGADKGLNPYRKNCAGIQAGASFEINYSSRFAVLTELYWALKGSTLKEGNPLTNATSHLRLSTLELPVLARVHFGNFFVNAGPYVSYLLGGRIRTEELGSLPESKTKISFGKMPGGFNRLETGLQGGGGYDFQLKRSTFTLDLRYGYGLTSLSKEIDRFNRTYVIGIRIAKRK